MTLAAATQQLLQAAKAGDIDTATTAIEDGADVHACDHYGYTPLHLAAMNGHAGIARLLIARGAYVNATDDGRRTPLHLAVANGQDEIVAMLKSGTN